MIKLCLCHIENCFDLSNSNLSRHLKELEQAGLIAARKITKWKYYQLSEIGNSFAKFIVENDKQNLLEEIKIKSKSIKKEVLC